MAKTRVSWMIIPPLVFCSLSQTLRNGSADAFSLHRRFDFANHDDVSFRRRFHDKSATSMRKSSSSVLVQDQETTTALSYASSSSSPSSTRQQSKNDIKKLAKKSKQRYPGWLPDPSEVEFVPCETVRQDDIWNLPVHDDEYSHYPFALMMQGSAPYIAAHAGKVAVVHLPGELLVNDNDDDDNKSDSSHSIDHLLSDLALARLLGMKIVLVVSCRFATEACRTRLPGIEHSHECHNCLQITHPAALRSFEEEAGFLRTEVERRLNRFLNAHSHHHGGGGGSHSSEGNVVSGNFYTAQKLGHVLGRDFAATGFPSQIHTEHLLDSIWNNDDVVVLSTVGMTEYGDLVHVNGYHLAATVAASLQAHKLIYMASCKQGTVLQQKTSGKQKKNDATFLQEIPVSFARAITDYHNVKVHNTGFSTFDDAREMLEPAAVEHLLHLAWTEWALQQGVERGHIVNPGDGALLEELFTSKYGANTCIYQDHEDPWMMMDSFNGVKDNNVPYHNDEYENHLPVNGDYGERQLNHHQQQEQRGEDWDAVVEAAANKYDFTAVGR